MTSQEAARLIGAIADSLEKNPGQFHFRMIIADVAGFGSHGGTGIRSSATGGGPGSIAIGTLGSGQGKQANITQGEIGDAQAQAIRQTSAILRELAETTEQDKEKVPGLLEKLRSATLVPAMVVDTVNTALLLANVIR